MDFISKDRIDKVHQYQLRLKSQFGIPAAQKYCGFGRAKMKRKSNS